MGINTVTRIYMDFEFHEQGVLDHPIDVISLGMYVPIIGGASETPQRLYLQNLDADWETIAQNSWLVENVLPHLEAFNMELLCPDIPPEGPLDPVWVHRAEMGERVVDFALKWALDMGVPIQMRGWYADYDHAILAGLFGKMIDMPRRIIPIWTYDCKQRVWELERLTGQEITFPPQANEHHALADAMHLASNDAYLDVVERNVRAYASV